MALLLARLRILHKALLPVLILAVVAAASVGFTQWTALRSQIGLQRVLDVEARAAVLSTRANLFLVNFTHLTWRAVAQADAGLRQSAAAEMRELKPRVDEAFAQLAAVLPDAARKAQIEPILALFNGMGAMADQAAQLNGAGSQAAALAMLNQAFQPTSQHVRQQTSALTTELIREAEAASAAIEAEAARDAMIAKLAAGIGVLLAVAAGIVITLSGVTRPLLGLNATMQRLARGERDIAIPGADRRDELGEMARSVSVFAEGLSEAERLKAEQEALKIRVEAERRAAMLALAGGFETSVGAVVGAIANAARDLTHASGVMAGVAERTTSQAQDVAMTAGQASSNVATVASAAEELSASVREISQQVATSARIAHDAVSESERANQTVAELSTAAARIGDVVRLIGDIAGQTNLLALNATIEAARAGEAGKGFAVVASEVKSLAAQTAKATEEIGGQIGAMQAATSQAVQAIGGIGGTITRMSEIASAIAAAVEEQGAATAEIARNVGDAASGTDRVSRTIGDVTQSANDTGSAATQVQNTATTLSSESERLSVEVTRFLSGVRAA